MNRTVKERFVRLLESGEYKFGRKVLYNPSEDSHCPLGVLVEQAIDEGVYEPEVRVALGGDKVLKGGRYFPPEAVLEWAGLTNVEIRNIANLNDTYGADKAIKYIKDNL